MELMPSKKITEKFNFLKYQKDKKTSTVLKKIGSFISVFCLFQLMGVGFVIRDLARLQEVQIDFTTNNDLLLSNFKSENFEATYKKVNKILVNGTMHDTYSVINYLTTSINESNNNLRLSEQKKMYLLINDYKYTNVENEYRQYKYMKKNCFLGINSNLFASCMIFNSIDLQKEELKIKQKIDLEMSYMEKKLK